MTSILACAKINIGLYVTERRPDGYHNLQTVFYPIPLHDKLEAEQLPEDYSGQRCSLQIVGNEIEGDLSDNLVVKAYRLLHEEFSLPPLQVCLHKHIPTGAGLGGGSSDAAAMMTMLNDTYRLGLSVEEMQRRVARLGADCAFFVKPQPAYAEGIGDLLTPFHLSLKGKVLLLVKPDIFVSTREAYAGVCPKMPNHDLRQALQQPITEWRSTVFNDFEKSVFAAHPAIAVIKQKLYDMGALYAAMSGSGSSVFGIFDHVVDDATSAFADCFVFQETL